jgi:hypothetical protein
LLHLKTVSLGRKANSRLRLSQLQRLAVRGAAAAGGGGGGGGGRGGRGGDACEACCASCEINQIRTDVRLINFRDSSKVRCLFMKPQKRSSALNQLFFLNSSSVQF